MEEPLSFVVTSEVPLAMQFPQRLSQHYVMRLVAQAVFPDYQFAVRRYLICPSSRTGFEFQDKPCSSSEFPSQAGC